MRSTQGGARAAHVLFFLRTMGAGEYLGQGEDGREWFLYAGRVYAATHEGSTAAPATTMSAGCPLSAYNRLSRKLRAGCKAA